MSAGFWQQFGPSIVNTGAPWLLVFLLIVWYVRGLRKSYDERLAEKDAHQAEIVALLHQTLDIGAKNADTNAAALPAQQAVKTVIEALPVSTGAAS